MSAQSNSKKKKAGKKSRDRVSVKASPHALRGLTGVFRQLSDESRLKILLALAEEGEMHVSALCELLNQTQPGVSHHLTLLRMTGLVAYRRAGKNNYYRLDGSFLVDLLQEFFASIGCLKKPFRFSDFSLTYKRSRQ